MHVFNILLEYLAVTPIDAVMGIWTGITGVRHGVTLLVQHK